MAPLESHQPLRHLLDGIDLFRDVGCFGLTELGYRSPGGRRGAPRPRDRQADGTPPGLQPGF